MIVRFIGTGSGKTSLKRFHSSFIFDNGSSYFLIDAGDGVAKGLLQQELDIDKISTVLFTHYHSDHFSGISSLITQMKLSERKKKLCLITHKELILPLRNYLNYCYLFEESLGFETEIFGFEHDEPVIMNDWFTFLARRNNHIRPKPVFSADTPVPFVSSSFLFKLGAKNLFYSSDVGSPSDLYLFRDYKLDYFISEISHVSPETVLNSANELKINLTVLTHIDEENESSLEEWVQKLDKPLSDKIILAFDGLKLEL
jgi:ribonuclease Z